MRLHPIGTAQNTILYCSFSLKGKRNGGEGGLRFPAQGRDFYAHRDDAIHGAGQPLAGRLQVELKRILIHRTAIIGDRLTVAPAGNFKITLVGNSADFLTGIIEELGIVITEPGILALLLGYVAKLFIN